MSSRQFSLHLCFIKLSLEEVDEGGQISASFSAAVKRRTFVVATVTIAVAAYVTQVLISMPTYQGRFQLLIKPLTVENKLSSSPSQR